MGNYTLEYKQTSNSSTRGFYGAGVKPLGITIHHWGSKGQKHSSVVAWLRGKSGGTSNTGSSAHYVVSDKLVTQLEVDTRATWHAGNKTGNGTTIGIEMRPEMTDQDWDTLVQLCTDLEERHGSLKYYKHSDWKATACPGAYGSRIGELAKAVNAEHKRRKSGGSTKPSKPSKPSSGSSSGSSSSGGKVGGEWPTNLLAVDGKFWLVTKRGYQRLLAPKSAGNYRGKIDGKISSATVKAEQRWLKNLGYYGKGYIIDGQRGPATIKALQRFLKDKGFYKGLIDGKFQTMSIKALQSYMNSQRKHYK